MSQFRYMIKDNKIYLELILEAINKVEIFVSGLSFENFVVDSKTQSAVLMQFHVIGELVKKIPEDIKNSIEIPWKEIAGFRDIISHDYFNVDSSFVWETILKDLPELKLKIRNYLEIK